jgi:DNA-binding transcriptional regulator YiaG
MEKSIKELRQKLGMSQSKFASYMNIPLPNIQKWEAGRTAPPEYVFCMILRILKSENPNVNFEE